MSFSTLRQDIRLALRALMKWPAFSLMAILTLALGLGANVAIFSIVNAVLLHPLPYEDPDRLLVVFEEDRQQGTEREGASPPDFFDWKEQQDGVFERLVAFEGWQRSLTEAGGEPERIAGGSVSHDFFAALGAQPVQGRAFLPQEDQPGGEQVLILSHALWQGQFGGDRNVLGKSLTLDGAVYEVVGVMPPDFVNPIAPAEAWAPLQYSASSLGRGRHLLRVFARLAPGATLERAQSTMDAIASRLEQLYPEFNSGRGVQLVTLREVIVGDIRPTLLLLLAAVGLVLLIACVNVASVLLARALARQREVAVRAALGASRRRLVQQLLTESVVLAILGGGAGLLLAVWGVRLLRALGPEDIPRLASVSIDVRVLVFTFVVSLLTGIAFGLVPATRLSRTDVQGVLKDGATSGAGVQRQRLRSALVVAEVALAVVLTISAGLVIKSLLHLRSIDPGFQAENLLKLQLKLPESRYPQPRNSPTSPEMVSFFSQAVDRLSALPGVESAAVALNHPLQAGWTTGFAIDDAPPLDPGQEDEARMRPVTPGYFEVVGLPIVAGQPFTEADQRPVVLINQAMAERYFPDRSPVGRRLSFWGVSREVVGVVGDERFLGLETDTEPAIYPSLLQLPMREVSVIVRTRQDPLSALPDVRSAIWEIDRDLAIFEVGSMEDLLAQTMGQPRFSALLLTTFAVIALVLAAIGIYGLIWYLVTQRGGEIGVRMAIGADRGDVLRLVLGQGLRLLAYGLALGLLASLASGRLLSSMLFGVEAHDSAIYVLVSLLLAVVGLAACCVPSLRASRINPGVVLRLE